MNSWQVHQIGKAIKFNPMQRLKIGTNDWLLPMLMNGQVRVSGADEKLAMVAEPQASYPK